jgi:two-component system sensor histidine kinase HupT/HoxJ
VASRPNASLKIGGRVEGGMAVLRFADNGPGIPEAHLGRLFEPFFTTKPVGQGTGLGLSISYGIVERHGGKLSAGNLAGGGAEFVLALPVESR